MTDQMEVEVTRGTWDQLSQDEKIERLRRDVDELQASATERLPGEIGRLGRGVDQLRTESRSGLENLEQRIKKWLGGRLSLEQWSAFFLIAGIILTTLAPGLAC